MIVLDLSRLISRAQRDTPTGIDRVELAYAQHLIANRADLGFAAMTLWGRLGSVPRAAAEAYVAAIGRVWRGDSGGKQPRRLAYRLRVEPLWRGAVALPARMRSAVEKPVYLLVSHHHLEKRRVIARLKARGRASFVCLIHDLIPIEFPEYAVPGQAGKHRRRIETAAALADALIVNSRATRDALQPYLDRAGRAPPVLVAPFGVSLPDLPATGSIETPYFVCISTIEARKNQLLLLNLWRRIVEERGAQAPRLFLIGRRGWETENTLDMLERCPRLRGIVVERSHLTDIGMVRLLKGARALLLPSFAEGFGFPLVEALALGVPALCSNIGALRENGGAVPEYFDPLDGPGWRTAILDYSPAASPRRDAQLRRLAGWQPASWQDHFAAVGPLIAEAAARACGRAASVEAGPPVPQSQAR